MPHVFTRTVSDPDQGPASSSHSGHVAAARWSRAELELERDGGMGAWGGGTGGHAPAVQSRPRRPPRVPADTRAPTSSPSLCRKLLPKTTQVAGWTPPPSWPPGRALRRRRGPRPGAAAHGPRGRPASHLTPCPSQRPTRPPSTPRVHRTSAGKPTWGRWGPLPRPWGPLTSRGSKCRLVLYRKRKSGSMRVCGFPGPQINKTTSAGTQQPALCWPRAERSVLARVLPPPSSWARGRAPRRTRLGDFSRGTESKGQVAQARTWRPQALHSDPLCLPPPTVTACGVRPAVLTARAGSWPRVVCGQNHRPRLSGFPVTPTLDFKIQMHRRLLGTRRLPEASERAP